MLSDNLLPDPQAGGRLRTNLVRIGQSVFEPLAIPQLIECYFDQMLATAQAIRDPFEQAFFILVQLPYLQPFVDVNKRVSRLAANISLIRANLCPLSFIDVPERAYIEGLLSVYELTQIALLRDVFIWAYERSCARYSALKQSLGEPDPFRMKYRAAIFDVVTAVITQKLNKNAAAKLIKELAEIVTPKEDKARFIEVAETELMSLHTGNIARYRVRPSEYELWKNSWR